MADHSLAGLVAEAERRAAEHDGQDSGLEQGMSIAELTDQRDSARRVAAALEAECAHLRAGLAEISERHEPSDPSARQVECVECLDGCAPAWTFIRTPDGTVEYEHPAGQAFREATTRQRQLTPAEAYADAVAALNEVRPGPLSTTIGYLIRSGYLVPKDNPTGDTT